MRLPLLRLSLTFTLLFTLSSPFDIKTARGKDFIPPAPDKAKTLPANDGGPDGCNSSRFKCIMGGVAVLDKQTGLIWARNTEILEKLLPWQEAIKFAEEVEIGGGKGWRLPTRDELISILDTSRSRPALPEGHPFSKMNDFPTGGPGSEKAYWTSTEYEEDDQSAWIIGLNLGKAFDIGKIWDNKIWPVRDGE